jgi:plastocyanin
MKLRLAVLLAAVLLASVAVATEVQASAPAGAAARTSHRLQVKAFEFGFTFSRPAVGAGQVTIEMNNIGEDEHNLRVKRLHSRARARGTRDVAPGTRVTRTFRLRAGTYRLFCSIGRHAKRGMSARLRVRRS